MWKMIILRSMTASPHFYFWFPPPCLFQLLCLCQRRRISWIISLFLFFSHSDLMPSAPQQLRGRFSQLSLWIKEWTEGHRTWNAVLHTSLVFGPVNNRSRCHIWAEKCTRAWVLRHMTASWVFLDWSKRREGCTSSLTLFERHFSSWLTSTVVPLTAKASWVGKRFRSRRSQTKGTSRWVSAQVSLLWQMLSFLWPCDLLIYWFM